MTSVNPTSKVVARASAALLKLKLAPNDPFAASLTQALLHLRPDVDSEQLISHWETRSVGSPSGDMRYRWELDHRHVGALPPYAPSATWAAWRAIEAPLLERDPFQFEARLSVPVVLCDAAELLASRAAVEGKDGRAARLLDEASPALRRDFAGFIQAIHPWNDTFALWCLSHHPRALALLHPLAVAIATCHAADLEPGMNALHGKRFPFHQQPLASASAQLATGLLALGLELEKVGRLAAFVSSKQDGSGGWGDVEGESDVLTTLVVADLLCRVDPSFDTAATAQFLASRQSEDGLFRALGPEAPWLTWEVIAWFQAAARPFQERFRWPFVVDANRDHKTRLPFFAYFIDVARLFKTLPGLARVSTEMAFIDLAGFRAFNNQHGQGRGDDVLRAFADALVELSAAAVVRDGGDEFLIVGAPRRTGLFEDFERFRQAWPGRFARIFGHDVPPVAPRILVAESQCGAIVDTRERLGREIGRLKESAGPLGPEGVLAKL